MNLKHSLESLRQNWSSRHWYTTVFNSYIAGRLYQKAVGNDGEYVVNKDWDNLIILDGCRFDLFSEVYNSEFESDLPGDLQQVVSRGSGSPEFLRENFNGRDLSDTVYVSANPFVYKVLDDPFYAVDHVWMNEWDDDLETVRPDTMVKHALRANKKYPNKRLIIHFMQPHHPFIGEYRLPEDRGYLGAKAKSLDENVPNIKFIWERLREGELSKEEVWKAYRDNLSLALSEVTSLTEKLDGKHVISSDHGNAFGERVYPFPTTTYGHGDYLRIPCLVNVPWLVMNTGERRKIVSGKGPTSSSEYESETIEERLESLGYR